MVKKIKKNNPKEENQNKENIQKLENTNSKKEDRKDNENSSSNQENDIFEENKENSLKNQEQDNLNEFNENNSKIEIDKESIQEENEEKEIFLKKKKEENKNESKEIYNINDSNKKIKECEDFPENYKIIDESEKGNIKEFYDYDFQDKELLYENEEKKVEIIEKPNYNIITNNKFIQNYQQAGILDNKDLNAVNISSDLFMEFNKNQKGQEEVEALKSNLLAKTDESKKCSDDVQESEFFRISRNSNAIKLRKEILKIQNRADKYMEKLYLYTKNFSEIKKKLKDRYNSFYTSMLIFFGFDYRENFKRSNFFTLASEAWIVEAVKEFENIIKSSFEERNDNSIDEGIEKKIQKNKSEKSEKIYISDAIVIDFPNNFTFANVFKRLVRIDVGEEDYLINLAILTGSVYCQSYDSATTKLIENNIGKVYLNSLKSVLSEIEFNESHEDEELDQKKFEIAMIDIFKKAVEKTLNSMDYYTADEKFGANIPIKYLECFEKFRSMFKENSAKFNFEVFYEILKNENNNYNTNINGFAANKHTKLNNGFSANICAESFFNFSLMKFDEIVEDLWDFIKKFNSLHFRIRSKLGQSVTKIMDFNKKSMNFLKVIIVYLMKKMNAKIRVESDTIDKLFQFYEKKYPEAFKTIDNQKKNIRKSYNFCKNWVDSSCNMIKMSGKNIYDSHLYNKYQFLSNNFVFPLLKFTYSNTNSVSKFFISKSTNCSICLNNFWKKIINQFTEKSINITNKLINFCHETTEKIDLKKKLEFLTETNEYKSFLFDESQDKKYFVVSINKKFFGNIIRNFINIRVQIKNISENAYKTSVDTITELPDNILKISVDKTDNILDYLMVKYDEIIEAESEDFKK